MAAKDKRQQGNKSGGTRNRQNRRSDDRAAGARRQHAPDAAPTRAAAEPTRPTERNKLPSGAQAGASAQPTAAQGGRRAGATGAPRPHLRDDRAAWHRPRIDIGSLYIHEIGIAE